MATNTPVCNKKTYRIVLVGDSPSGKSSLILSYLHNQFNHTYDSNIGDNFTKPLQIDGKSIDLSIVDTCGGSAYDRLRPLSYPLADIILICFSVDDSQSLINVVEKWIPEIRHYCGLCPVILVACKIDLRDNSDTISKLKQQDEKPIKSKTGKKLASKIHADAYIECSAKTHENIDGLFMTAARLAIKKTLSLPMK